MASHLKAGTAFLLAFELGAAQSTWGEDYVKGGNLCGLAEGSLFEPVISTVCDCGEDGDRCDDTTGRITSQITAWLLGNESSARPGTFEIFGGIPVVGSRRFHAEKDVDVDSAGKVAVISGGSSYGNWLGGAYVGSTSYLVQEGNFSYDVVDFVSAATDSFLEHTYVSSICLIPSANSTSTSFSCGEKRSAAPGHMKFSIYGYTFGDFNTLAQAYADGYMLFRQTICFKGVESWKINGMTKGEGYFGDNSTSSAQVTSIEVLQSNSTGLSYSFPQEYVFGSVANCTRDGLQWWGVGRFVCEPSGTKTVVITASPSTDCGTSDGINIEYAFEMSDLIETGSFFAYDPDVEATSEASEADDEDSLVSGSPSTALVSYSSIVLLLAALFAA
jgi:hypothetical protein